MAGSREARDHEVEEGGTQRLALTLVHFVVAAAVLAPHSTLYINNIAIEMLLCVVYALGFIVAFGGLVWGLEYLRRARNVRQTLTQMMAAGEWVLITGASSGSWRRRLAPREAQQRRNLTSTMVAWCCVGLGAEFAKSFAAMGYSCVLVARGQEGLDKMAASLHRQYGVPVKTIAADLSNREVGFVRCSPFSLVATCR